MPDDHKIRIGYIREGLPILLLTDGDLVNKLQRGVLLDLYYRERMVFLAMYHNQLLHEL